MSMEILLFLLTANQAILPPSDNMLRLAKVEKKQIAKAYYDLDAEVMVRIPSSERESLGLSAII